MTTKDTIGRGLKRLAALQAKDGSFPSLCSPDPKSFARSEERRTVFPAALALWSLSRLTDPEHRKIAAPTMRKSAKFLLGQAGPQGTWNYMARGSADAKRRPYPDDLDDTACALVGLQAAGIADGEGKRVAAFVSALIATETVEGGPYRTWIAKLGGPWDDVDPVVNANVAFCLARQDVRLAPLDAFVDACARKRRKSLYYHSDLAISYFISRALEGRIAAGDAAAIESGKALAKRVSAARLGNALDAALAASALARLGAPGPAGAKALKALVAKEPANGRWPACPFYIEEIKASGKAKTAHYAGSEAITTLFAIEALALGDAPSRASEASPKNASEEDPLAPVRALAARFVRGLPPALQESADAAFARIRAKGLEAFIALLPHSFARAATGIGQPAPETLDRLGFANLLGWIGYTIQDDVIDEGRGAELLPLSNAALRESLRILESEASTDEGRAYVRGVFDRIDAANAAEARNPIALGDLLALADKSFGHALGPIIVAHRSGVAVGGAPFRELERFFASYIAARQLSDDAHDWEADLRAGRANPAIAPLFTELAERGEADLPPKEDAMNRLKERFWEKRVLEVCADAKGLCADARAAARRSGIVPDALADRLVAPVERSADKAVAEREKTLDFIASFKNKA